MEGDPSVRCSLTPIDSDTTDAFDVNLVALRPEGVRFQRGVTADALAAMPFAWSGERAVDDFVLLTCVCGNDFIPHLPSLDIGDGAIDLPPAPRRCPRREVVVTVRDGEMPPFPYPLTHPGARLSDAEKAKAESKDGDAAPAKKRRRRRRRRRDEAGGVSRWASHWSTSAKGVAPPVPSSASRTVHVIVVVSVFMACSPFLVGVEPFHAFWT